MSAYQVRPEYRNEPSFEYPSDWDGPRRLRYIDEIKAWVRMDWLEPKHQVQRAFQIMGDYPEYVSPIDGSHVTTRPQHREHLKVHNVVEVGNEVQRVKVFEPDRAGITQAITESINTHSS